MLARILLISLLQAFSFSAYATSTGIPWQSWGEHAFDQAKQQDKLIFLDVGTEWCGACNQMQHETYSDEIIQKRLDEDFISIHV
ncbi:MAG: hypothetical protein ACI9FD_001463, partial [Gammaproteobacteria bacterium]